LPGGRAEALRREKEEAERMNRAMMNREGRIVELKREINPLLGELRRSPKYSVEAS